MGEKTIIEIIKAMFGYFRRKREAKEQARMWEPYALYTPCHGTTVWRFNPPPGEATPMHYACPACRAKNGALSILQQQNEYMHHCSICRVSYRFKAAPASRPRFAIMD